MIKIKDLLKDAQKTLIENKISEPRPSAEILLGHVLGISREKLYAYLDQGITEQQLHQFKRLLKRRLKHESVWQIIGEVEFCNQSFLVNRHVLVPRPETEILVQEVIKRAKLQKKRLKIFDVGTGSGVIICSLAQKINNADFFASDISSRALAVAKKNALRFGLGSKIKFKRGNLFEPWQNFKFDIVTANLPYVPHENLKSLALEVHHYEPRLALDGGKGGLVVYENFLAKLLGHLNKPSWVFCEIGADQGKDFQRLAAKYLPQKNCQITKDLAGLDRLATLKID